MKDRRYRCTRRHLSNRLDNRPIESVRQRERFKEGNAAADRLRRESQFYCRLSFENRLRDKIQMMSKIRCVHERR